MGEMRTFVIMIVIISCVALGLSGVIGESYNNYGQTAPNISFINRAANVSAQLTTMTNSVNQQPVSGGLLTIFFEVGTGVYGGFVLLLNIPSLFGGLVADIGNLLGIGVVGGWATTLIFLIVGIIFLFEFFSTVMRREI